MKSGNDNNIPKSHPRYNSLMYRHKLVRGIKEGYVSEAGLIAHGRGEAFDYLISEQTIKPAKEAEQVAIAAMLLSKNPVISVNGNVAALVPKEIVRLCDILNARIEINLFYRTLKREKLIEKILKENGAREVFSGGMEKTMRLPGIDHPRGMVSEKGIFNADTVLVPLEDGDRTDALIAMGKSVIAIDLNPLSRTAQKASITIVDNIVRAIPNMIEFANEICGWKKEKLKKMIENFDNKKNLNDVLLSYKTTYCRFGS